MPLYEVAGHPLLNEAAQRLGSEALAAQTVLAEELLGLAGTSFTGADLERVKMAVALQVSLQATLPMEALLIKSESRGARTVTYRDNLADILQPQAVLLVDSLLVDTDQGGGWATAGPRR